MTVALAIRVSEGVVLAADTQVSLISRLARSSPAHLVQIYTGGSKVLRLRDHPPLGALTWGAAAIAGQTLRSILAAAAESLPSEVAPDAAARHLLEYCQHRFIDAARQDLGLLVAGYAPGALAPDCWRCGFAAGAVEPPTVVEDRLFWVGDGAGAISRLVLGHDESLHRLLLEGGLGEAQAARLAHRISSRCRAHLVHPEMPLPDAERLARLLVATAIGFDQARSASATAGGVVECVTLKVVP